MVDRIFIPTVHRVNNQITYNALPEKYKKKVTMVVQSWERSQYTYDCNYFVLPDTPDYHYSNYYCLPKTRKLIYQLGKDITYCVFDDDVEFGRRNAKYHSSIADMEKSKRKAIEKDYEEMFNLFDNWLENEDITVCGCSQIENPPSGVRYRENTSLTSALWINGKAFKDVLDEMDLTSVKVGEDVCFLLSLLVRGYRNRVSDEFVIINNSNANKNMKSTVWDQQTYEQTLKDHKYLEKIFPRIFEILYDNEGNRLSGGYKNFGKSKIHWNKAYNNYIVEKNSIERFMA